MCLKAVQVHTDLDKSAEALLSTVETVATEVGVVSGLVDNCFYEPDGE